MSNEEEQAIVLEERGIVDGITRMEQSSGADNTNKTDEGVNLNLLEDGEEESAPCSKTELDKGRNGVVGNKELSRSVVKSTFSSVRYQKVSRDGEWSNAETSCGLSPKKLPSSKKRKDNLFDIEDEQWHNDTKLSYAERNINWFIKTFTPISLKKDCVERGEFVKFGRKNQVRHNFCHIVNKVT